MNTTDTPAIRRQAELLEKGKSLPSDQARAEFIAKVRQEHGRFAASLLRADLIEWHRAKKGGKA